MATKQELEQKVLELQEKIAALESAAPGTAETDRSENELLKQQVEDLKSLVTSADARETILKDENESLKKRVSELESLNSDLFEIKKTADSCTSADHVVLDGTRYLVIHRNTVKELAQDLLKRYVQEELTAVVIRKHGG